jgi:hypothetical protein
MSKDHYGNEDYICYFQVGKLDNYIFLCKMYQGNSERLYSLTSYYCRFVMSHEILFLDSNLILFFNSQVKSALLCCSLMCTWIGCSHPVKGVIKLSCCMQSLVPMLSWSLGEFHAFSLMESAISEFDTGSRCILVAKMLDIQ